MVRTLIIAAQLPSGVRTDLLLEDDRIVELGTGLTSVGAQKIFADGLIALPGLVDLRVRRWGLMR